MTIELRYPRQLRYKAKTIWERTLDLIRSRDEAEREKQWQDMLAKVRSGDNQALVDWNEQADVWRATREGEQHA